MDEARIEELFREILGKLGVIEERQRHTATRECVLEALEKHRRELHNGLSPKKLAALVTAITALAGGIGAALAQMFG